MNQKNKSHKITLPTLVAYNSTDEAQRLITTKYGYPRARNVKELEHRLAQIIVKHPDGLKSVTMIHPHADLILEHHRPVKMEGGGESGYRNATGFPPEPTYVFRGQGVEPTLMEVEDWGDVRYRRRPDNYSADGTVNKILGTGGIILGILAFGTILVAFGNQQRSYK